MLPISTDSISHNVWCQKYLQLSKMNRYLRNFRKFIPRAELSSGDIERLSERPMMRWGVRRGWSSGLEQGIMLGPDLWNANYNSLPEESPLVGYADDVAGVKQIWHIDMTSKWMADCTWCQSCTGKKWNSHPDQKEDSNFACRTHRQLDCNVILRYK